MKTVSTTVYLTVVLNLDVEIGDDEDNDVAAEKVKGMGFEDVLEQGSTCDGSVDEVNIDGEIYGGEEDEFGDEEGDDGEP